MGNKGSAPATTPAIAPAVKPPAAPAVNSRSLFQKVSNSLGAAGNSVRKGVVGAATSVTNLVVPPKSTSEVPSVPASNPSASKLPGAPMEQGPPSRGGCWNMKRKRRTKKKSRKAKKSKRSNK